MQTSMVRFMNVIVYIFSFLCNQNPFRSFMIADHLMPLCQRCTGLYTGMGLSLLWFLVSCNYNKGLPPREIIYVNIICLLLMPVFGFHFLDPGPAWRLWSGLIYGNAIVSLFLPAAFIIYNKNRRITSHKNSSTFSFWIFFAFLNSIPLWFPIQSVWFYYAEFILILLGLMCIVIGILIVIVFLMKRFVKFAIVKGFCYGH